MLVTIAYRFDSAKNCEPFLKTAEHLAGHRRRDGAYAWGVFEDTAERGRLIETFVVESWLEHQPARSLPPQLRWLRTPKLDRRVSAIAERLIFGLAAPAECHAIADLVLESVGGDQWNSAT